MAICWEKAAHNMLTICYLCIVSTCNFCCSHSGFKRGTLVVIAPVPGHILPFTSGVVLFIYVLYVSISKTFQMHSATLRTRLMYYISQLASEAPMCFKSRIDFRRLLKVSFVSMSPFIIISKKGIVYRLRTVIIDLWHKNRHELGAGEERLLTLTKCICTRIPQ